MMLNLYVKAREAALRLRNDNDGVVSLEYVVVAALAVGIAVALFGSGGSLQTTVTDLAGRIARALAGITLPT